MLRRFIAALPSPWVVLTPLAALVVCLGIWLYLKTQGIALDLPQWLALLFVELAFVYLSVAPVNYANAQAAPRVTILAVTLQTFAFAVATIASLAKVWAAAFFSDVTANAPSVLALLIFGEGDVNRFAYILILSVMLFASVSVVLFSAARMREGNSVGSVHAATLFLFVLSNVLIQVDAEFVDGAAFQSSLMLSIHMLVVVAMQWLVLLLFVRVSARHARDVAVSVGNAIPLILMFVAAGLALVWMLRIVQFAAGLSGFQLPTTEVSSGSIALPEIDGAATGWTILALVAVALVSASLHSLQTIQLPSMPSWKALTPSSLWAVLHELAQFVAARWRAVLMIVAAAAFLVFAWPVLAGLVRSFNAFMANVSGSAETELDDSERSQAEQGQEGDGGGAAQLPPAVVFRFASPNCAPVSWEYQSVERLESRLADCRVLDGGARYVIAVGRASYERRGRGSEERRAMSRANQLATAIARSRFADGFELYALNLGMMNADAPYQRSAFVIVGELPGSARQLTDDELRVQLEAFLRDRPEIAGSSLCDLMRHPSAIDDTPTDLGCQRD